MKYFERRSLIWGFPPSPAAHSGQYNKAMLATAAHIAACAHQRHVSRLSSPHKLAPEIAASTANATLLSNSPGNSSFIAGLLPLSTRKMTTTPSRPNVMAAAEPNTMALSTASGPINGSRPYGNFAEGQNAPLAPTSWMGVERSVLDR